MIPFTWSHSRAQALERCPRAYGYAYYGARNGWRKPVGDPARALFRIKKLVGRSQWVGQLVHDAAAHVLERARAGQPPRPRDVRTDARRKARRAVDDARRGLAELDPRRHVDFLVRFYEGDPGDDWYDALLEDLDGQLAAWFEHPVTRRMLAVPERLREIERFERIHLAGVPIYLALDVLVDDGQGGLVVVDWKTGRAERGPEVGDQLALYAWHVHQRFRLPWSRIKVMEARTRDGTHPTWQVDVTHQHAAEDRLRQSVDQMRSWLLDPSKDQVPLDAFPRLDEGSEACVHCRWRRPCGREGAKN